MASRVESIANGGEICMTRDVESQLTQADRAELAIQPIGAVELKGVSGKTEILQCLPTSLRGRTFAKASRDETTDPDDETGSLISTPSTSMASHAVNESTVLAVKVLHGMMRAMRPKEKASVLEALGKSWRIHHPKSDDDLLEQVGRRIAHFIKTQQEPEKCDIDDTLLQPTPNHCSRNQQLSESNASEVESLPGAVDEKGHVQRTSEFSKTTTN